MHFNTKCNELNQTLYVPHKNNFNLIYKYMYMENCRTE